MTAIPNAKPLLTLAVYQDDKGFQVAMFSGTGDVHAADAARIVTAINRTAMEFMTRSIDALDPTGKTTAAFRGELIRELLVGPGGHMIDSFPMPAAPTDISGN